MESVDVQLEHGYTRLANRLVEALSVGDFTGTQTKIVLAIWRDTYGWQEQAVTITLPELADKCGLAFTGGFRRAFTDLMRAGVIMCVDGRANTSTGTYMVQKNFAQWGAYSLAENRLAALWDKRPSHVAVVKPAPEAPAAPPEKPKEPEPPKPPKTPAAASWPAKAVEIWAKERSGAVLTHGVVGKHLKPVVTLLGEEETLARWTTYARALKGNEAKFASAAHFAAHHPEYAKGRSSAPQVPPATSMVR